jgi:anti-sigma factor RsiW
MNPDPVYNRWRELSWRRSLTESEQVELRAWLAAHPEARAEWETDVELSGLLNQLPAAPVPSNFTARVLQEVARERAAVEPQAGFWRTWHWQMWLPRAAAAMVFVGLGLFAYRHQQIKERDAAIGIVATIPEVKPEVLEDFEAIRRLGSTPPDEELLALMK